ncbi:hypothetical protein [uncultured Kiloniella sp.]|uniref:hypothetical protein n=1 Tax=uncultured Kiloniella sp. TaxID=1133091 RepID=UPI00260BA141|nr:hypothetical protein [uncultured Kiloniella sp.]
MRVLQDVNEKLNTTVMIITHAASTADRDGQSEMPLGFEEATFIGCTPLHKRSSAPYP